MYKAIESVIGEPKNIKKLWAGELLIKTQKLIQVSKLKKCILLANIPITVTAHRTLNSCRGVISDPDLQYVPEEEILENFKDRNITDVWQITI